MSLLLALTAYHPLLLEYICLGKPRSHDEFQLQGSLRNKALGFPASTVQHPNKDILLFFSSQIVSDTLWPHGLHNTRLFCLSLYPGVCSNSCPLSRWCHLAVSPSIAPFSFCLQSFPASRSFLEVWLKYCSLSFSNNPSNEYLWLAYFRIDWFDLLAVQGTLKRFLQHHSLNASSLQCSAFFMIQLSHTYMTTWKTIVLTIWTLVT